MKMIDVRNELPRHPSRRYARRKIEEIDIIAIHHSLTKEGSPEAFARYHVQNNGWPGIGYAYVIGKDGTIYITNDLESVSYHAGQSNRRAVGVCLIGDFRVEKPTSAQYQAAIQLVRYLLYLRPGAQVKGHSELPGYAWKQCPVIDMNQFRKDVLAVGEKQSNLLKKEDAEKIIRFLQAGWNIAPNQEAKDEFHRLAEEIRKVTEK